MFTLLRYARYQADNQCCHTGRSRHSSTEFNDFIYLILNFQSSEKSVSQSKQRNYLIVINLNPRSFFPDNEIG